MITGTYQSMGQKLVFSPSDVANLVGWFRADAGTYQDSAGTTQALTNADPVGLWQDQSGQGNHVSQPVDAVRPTLRLAVRLGLPVIRFSLASTQSLRFLTAGGLDLARNVTALSVWVACVSTTTPADARVVGWDTNAVGNARYALVRNLGGTAANRLSAIFRRLDADARTDLDGGANTYANGTWDIEALVGNFSTMTFQLRKNGLTINFSSLGSGGSTSDTASADARIGGAQTQWFDGDVGEVLVYQSVPTDTEISRIEGYLNSRWGTFS